MNFKNRLKELLIKENKQGYVTVAIKKSDHSKLKEIATKYDLSIIKTLRIMIDHTVEELE
ncbi:hypothetical protein OAP76_00895 [Alphaproteobacteria bacterium]|nr:hypothetical protein [Alphaproteobacteria bacterium]